MNPAIKLVSRSFPSRIADLGFTADLPQDWVAHDLPAEQPNLSDPTVFVPLAVVTAPHAAIIFAFLARPAYDDGTLQDWAWYHLKNSQLQPRAVGRHKVAGVPAVIGEAVQQSDFGPMVVRFAFFEDGDRLINLTLSAPELFADTVRDAWFGMLQSFTLETPRGSRFKAEPHPDDTPVAPIPEPWLESKAQTDTPEAQPSAEAEESERSAEPVAPEEIAPDNRSEKRTFADFALEADTTSLDQATSLNADLRDRGIGLVPHVTAADDEDRRATVAAGAIMAHFDVPYGWHVIDDGRRTLVFEPTSEVQINLNLIPREGRSNEAILDAIEEEMRRDYPDPEFTRVSEGQIEALGARRIADGSQPLEQYHLLFPFRDDSMVLRARVTAVPERAADACNLAELILESCVFDFSQDDEESTPPATPPAEQQPAWWNEALALESGNELQAAEDRIRQGCPHIGFAASTAEMYRLRMRRLKAAGDDEGALAAFKKASDFIFFYASMATSGGEGAALSLERDQFRAQLVTEFGSDPER